MSFIFEIMQDRIIVFNASYLRSNAVRVQAVVALGKSTYGSVRKDDLKLIYHHAQKKIELFNLTEDIGEKKDLAKAKPEKAKELAKILGDHLRKTRALMPIDKRTKKEFPYPDEVI